MTRVLMLAPTPFFSDRGCHVRIYEEARELARAGVEVRIVTYPIGLDPPGIAIDRARRLGGYQRTEAGPSWMRLPLDLMVLARAARACREFRPHVIHAHVHEGALIGAVLKRRFRLPLVFDYQGSLTGESLHHGFIRPGGARAAAFASVERIIDSAADLIVTSSGPLADSLRGRGLNVAVLPDGVDGERFCPGPPDPALAQRLGLPPGVPVVVYLGVMSDYQGADLILAAARALRAAGERVHFLVMGYPEAQYARECARLGLSESITFTGRLDYFRAPDFLRLGAMAVAPKLASTEANGKVLNYMACGLPVAAFDLPVNREMLADAAEWVRPSGDRRELARSLAAALSRLLADPERRDLLARRGRERALHLFPASGLGTRLREIYTGLLRP